jgi:hypothetical protein
MRTLWICSACVALLTLAGCWGSALKAYGVTAWPAYDEPHPLAEGLTPDEAALLTQFASEHKDLYKKVQGQANAWRAIVQKHNEAALKINFNQLVGLGHEDAEAKRMILAKYAGKNITGLGAYKE